MSEYANLLRSPLWQQKRLQILNARGFQCEECQNKEQELHINHRHYEKGKKPWEYADEVYLVLCSDCHTERHTVEQDIRVELGQMDLNALLQLRNLFDIQCLRTSRTEASREGDYEFHIGLYLLTEIADHLNLGRTEEDILRMVREGGNVGYLKILIGIRKDGEGANA